MAVFIKKENLGSGSPRGNRPGSITRKVENLKTFQQLQQSYAEAKVEAQQSMKDKYESNAEVQHWRTQMTPEQRTRDAIERMIPTTRTVAEMRNGGKEVSYEDARKLAENIAYKAETNKKEDKE
jgi:hypothetical protein